MSHLARALPTALTSGTSVTYTGNGAGQTKQYSKLKIPTRAVGEGNTTTGDKPRPGLLKASCLSPLLYFTQPVIKPWLSNQIAKHLT